jgi:hypothetical protein
VPFEQHEAGDALGVHGGGFEAHLHAHAPAAEHRAVDALRVEHGEGVVGVVGDAQVGAARGGVESKSPR